MKTILIPDRSTEALIEESVFGSGFKIILENATDVSDISDEIWASCNGMLCWHDLVYSQEIISKLKNCKGIVRVGTGYDNVDISAAKKKGIIVSNVPDYGTNDVADHTLALILAHERGIVKYNNSLSSKGPWSWELGESLNRIQNKTIGIIGLGRIGMAVAQRLKSFGVKVIFYDPYVSIGTEKSLIIERAHSLENILPHCDIITLHTPLTSETRGMVNDEFISKMKDGSSLYNTARGEIIVMDDLYKALKEKKLKFAGLDVLEREPLDYNHEMIKAWSSGDPWIKNRLILTPHAAFYNTDSFKEMKRKAAEELKRILENKTPLNRVN